MLVSNGVLNEDLFFDAPFAIEVVWAMIGHLLPEWQKAAGDPAIWENFEWLGRRYESWKKERWKPKTKAFPPDQWKRKQSRG